MNIIVSAFSSRALVETAAQCDVNIYSFDYFGDQDLCKYTADIFSLKKDAESNYSIEELAALIEDFANERPLELFYFVYASSWDNHPHLIRRIENMKNIILLGNSSQILNNFLSKEGIHNLFKLLQKTYLKIPELIFEQNNLIEKIENNKSGKKYLLKPLKSGGGKKIELIQSRKDYQKLSRKLLEREDNAWTKDYYFEEYIEGEIFSLQFAADGNKAKIISISEQLTNKEGNSKFKYGGNILIKKNSEEIEVLEEAVQQLTKEYQLKGINGIDFIQKEGQLYFLELNPRFTAAVELLIPIYGCSLFKSYFAEDISKINDLDYLNNYLNSDFKEFGKVIYYAQNDIIIIADLAKINSDLANKKAIFENVEIEINDIPKKGEKFSRGDPVCTIIIRAENRDNFWRAAENTVLEMQKYFKILD